MPEGDTVWRAARSLDRALSGQVLTISDFRVPELATVDLTGREVVETLARGKHLLTRIGTGPGATTVHTHLKMEGSWHLHRPGERWRRPAHQARLILGTDQMVAVGFLLGIVELVPRTEEERVVGHLGPDLLGPDWDEVEVLRRLSTAPQRALTDALLDQRNVAGIGNLYANELCFLAGVHPRIPVGEVPDLGRLVRRARAILRANAERVEQTTTGNLRRGERVWVYRRDGQACRRCGTTVAVEMWGPAGRERATYWCQSCQPERGRHLSA